MTGSAQIIDDKGRVQGYAEGPDLTIVVDGVVEIQTLDDREDAP